MADNTLMGTPEELDLYVREVYTEWESEYPPEYLTYTKPETWDKNGNMYATVIRRQQTAGPNPAVLKGEGEPTDLQTFPTRRSKDLFDPITFATGFSVSKHKMDFGIPKLNSVNDIGRLIPEAIRRAVENYYITLLNEAESSSCPAEMKGFDGLCPVNTGHTFVGASGTTASNYYGSGTTYYGITYSSLNEVATMMARTLDEDGRYRPIYSFDQLWIPIEEERAALEVLQTPTRPDVLERVTNVLSSRSGYRLTQSGLKTLLYMTSDRWFAVDSAHVMATRYILEDGPIDGPFQESRLVNDFFWQKEIWLKRCWWGWRGMIMAKRS